MEDLLAQHAVGQGPHEEHRGPSQEALPSLSAAEFFIRTAPPVSISHNVDAATILQQIRAGHTSAGDGGVAAHDNAAESVVSAATGASASECTSILTGNEEEGSVASASGTEASTAVTASRAEPPSPTPAAAPPETPQVRAAAASPPAVEHASGGGAGPSHAAAEASPATAERERYANSAARSLMQSMMERDAASRGYSPQARPASPPAAEPARPAHAAPNSLLDALRVRGATPADPPTPREAYAPAPERRAPAPEGAQTPQAHHTADGVEQKKPVYERTETEVNDTKRELLDQLAECMRFTPGLLRRTNWSMQDSEHAMRYALREVKRSRARMAAYSKWVNYIRMFAATVDILNNYVIRSASLNNYAGFVHRKLADPFVQAYLNDIAREAAVAELNPYWELSKIFILPVVVAVVARIIDVVSAVLGRPINTDMLLGQVMYIWQNAGTVFNMAGNFFGGGGGGGGGDGGGGAFNGDGGGGGGGGNGAQNARATNTMTNPEAAASAADEIAQRRASRRARRGVQQQAQEQDGVGGVAMGGAGAGGPRLPANRPRFPRPASPLA